MTSIRSVPFEKELKKNPELKESDVQILRDWCKKQPHLPKISDSELALFLHSNYYQLESTKATIDTYFTIKTHVPEFFYNRDLNKNKELIKATETVTMQILEGTTREGYSIIYGRLLDDEPSHYVFNDVMKLLVMLIDFWIFTEVTSNGHVIIMDMTDISFGHVGRVSPMSMKKIIYYLQDGLPVRLKGLHFMNASPVLDFFLNIMKPFMKKQLINMLYTHTTNETLEEFVPLEVLPNEIGGQAGSIHELHNKQMKKLADHAAWFQEDEANHRVNESLRMGKAKTATDLFGVEGSFKMLQID